MFKRIHNILTNFFYKTDFETLKGKAIDSRNFKKTYLKEIKQKFDANKPEFVEKIKIYYKKLNSSYTKKILRDEDQLDYEDIQKINYISYKFFAPNQFNYEEMQKYDSNICSKDGVTILHEAISQNASLSFITLLLLNGANIDAKDKHGLTPLHYAYGKEPETVNKLLFWGADNETFEIRKKILNDLSDSSLGLNYNYNDYKYMWGE